MERPLHRRPRRAAASRGTGGLGLPVAVALALCVSVGIARLADPVRVPAPVPSDGAAEAESGASSVLAAGGTFAPHSPGPPSDASDPAPPPGLPDLAVLPSTEEAPRAEAARVDGRMVDAIADLLAVTDPERVSRLRTRLVEELSRTAIDSDRRRLVLVALGHLASPAVEAAVVGDLEVEHVGAREAAVRALRRTRAPGVGPRIARVLANDPEATVRIAAVEVLAERGDAPDAVRRALLEDDSADVRGAALLALARASNPAEARELARLADAGDPSPEVRAIARGLLEREE